MDLALVIGAGPLTGVSFRRPGLDDPFLTPQFPYERLIVIDVEGDICLASSKDWAFASIDGSRMVDGVKRKRFRKQLIMVGDFVKHADGIKFSVTPETLAHWAETFQRMKANGVKVPIPATHEGADDPDKNRGYVEDIFVDGDSLVMACDLIGDDAIAAAARNDVSIGCPAEFVDGTGNKYIRPIQHVALTPNPVIPGLGAFEPIAASHKPTPKEKNMDLKKLAKRVGIEVKLTDANALEEIGKAFDASGVLALSSVTKALGVKIESVDKIEAAVKGAVDKAVELSVAKAKPETKSVDPQMIVLSRVNCNHLLKDLVRDAKITPATSDKLGELYLSDTALSLSLGAGKGTQHFDTLCEILNGNDTVSLKAITKGQVLKLADPCDPKQNPMLAEAMRRTEAAKKTG